MHRRRLSCRSHQSLKAALRLFGAIWLVLLVRRLTAGILSMPNFQLTSESGTSSAGSPVELRINTPLLITFRCTRHRARTIRAESSINVCAGLSGAD